MKATAPNAASLIVCPIAITVFSTTLVSGQRIAPMACCQPSVMDKDLTSRGPYCYLPAESNNGMFGGNSNWRGPVWVPVNVIPIRALLNYFTYYGDSFKVECPTGSGRMMNRFEVAKEIADRLAAIFAQGHLRATAGLRRHDDVPGRPALARLSPVLRGLPRRQRRRPGRQSTRRDGRVRSRR